MFLSDEVRIKDTFGKNRPFLYIYSLSHSIGYAAYSLR